MTHAVLVRDLTVVRGRTRAVDAVSLEVARGEIVGLLGPSGCGKSSLLRALVGVQIVGSGRVEVLGEPAGSASLRRRVGYVTQAASVYDDLAVGENLAFFATVLGVGRGAVDRVLDQVGLAGHRRRLVGSLSGGERSRVSLAVALLGEPELLVLDEPTVGLDPVLRRELWVIFHRLASAGATLIVSSHAMDEAARCDRLVLLREGRVLASGTPAAILERTGCATVEDAFLALVAAPR